MKFLLNREEELTPLMVTGIIQQFITGELPRLKKWYNYYDGKQAILRKPQNNEFKPDNKIVSNYCSTIVTAYQGYLTGIDISYSSDKDITEINEILRYNDVADEDNHLLRDALIYGKSFEICYIDSEGQQRMKVLDPRECIPIYTADLEEELLAVIRFYSTGINNIDIENNFYIDVYTDDMVRHYSSNSGYSSMNLINEEQNFYGMVPITVFPINQEEESIFNQIIGLQDAYNTLISSSVDDFEAFADAYMIVNGVELTEEQVQMIRENRIFNFFGDVPGTVEYLTKDIKTTQIENLLDRIDTKIHTVSNCPDFTDESFGTSSGIAMKYKLLGFENAAGTIEKKMTKALQRRIELFASIISLTGGEEIWRDVKITFHRNLPVDVNETVTEVNALRGLVSDRTLLSQLDFIDDVDNELDLIKAQKEEAVDLYGFNLDKELNEDEE